MAGYKFNTSGLLSDLSPAQLLFIAYTQNKYFEIMLAPYMKEYKPSDEELVREAMIMQQRHKKYKEQKLNFAGYDLFKWDGKSPLYEPKPD